MDASRLLTDTITVQTATGVDVNLTETFGAQRTIKARVEFKVEQVADSSGNTRVANHKVVTADEVTLADRVWLPGKDTTEPNESERPIAIGRAATPGGYTLWETRL